MKIMTPYTLDKAFANGGLAEHRTQAQIIIDRINGFFKDIAQKKPGIPNSYIEEIKANGHVSLKMDDDFFFTVGFKEDRYIVEAMHVVFFEDPEAVLPIVQDSFTESNWCVSTCDVICNEESDPHDYRKFIRIVAYMDKAKIQKSGR